MKYSVNLQCSLIHLVLYACSVSAQNLGLVVSAVLLGSQSNDYYPIRDMIQKTGYPMEVHLNVPTEDGYLLNMYRIPRGIRDGISEVGRPVVLLMHGLLGSCEDWIVAGPERGLAYILADAGYDVWMGNARGSTHSRKHQTLDPNVHPRYWDFSWHEIGYYDLPAKIKYIQRETGQNDLHYIGHSQGTTAFFVMCSMRPEYNNYIKLMTAMAPVAYMANAPSPVIKFFANFHSGIGFLTRLFGLNEIRPNSYLMEIAGRSLCNERAITSEICANLLFLVGGYDSVQLDRALIPSITSYAPAGACTKQFVHYGQGINSGSFCQFDYGVHENINKYGASTAPLYDISQISAPVAAFYSSNDLLVSTVDVERLCNELPNLALKYLVPFEQFNHLDFMYATDVVPLVYSEVLALMNRYR